MLIKVLAVAHYSLGNIIHIFLKTIHIVSTYLSQSSEKESGLEC